MTATIRIVLAASLDDVELAVVEVLNSQALGRRHAMTQDALAMAVSRAAKKPVGARQVRKVIRDLRQIYLAPIASGYSGSRQGGYFVQQNEQEFRDYIEAIDRHGRHHMQLVSAAKKSRNKYFPQSGVLPGLFGDAA